MAFLNNPPVEGAVSTSNSQEYRVATPRADLIVVRLGKSKSGAALRESEKSSALIERLAKAIREPGISRDIVFKSRRGKRVYAYSIFPGDVTKIVREDANGKKTVGRLVQGEFKPMRLPSAQASQNKISQ
jgi:hypothetical protein